ncbi:uncharacterized protein LOC106529611 [Austrofundulus limnaeus]|uniref:Uncharacterized protein LOC106529611 n=1 Tax=Austrofundulus limnaeus TaxID=52670 RepID=A0A2I4CKL0_AUSLI|nr:PREDICTED: uncharacterized protein LOC106529611 [Austrofundulus limnaeus]
MKSEINSVFSVLVLLTGLWQIGQAGSSPSPDALSPWTQHPAGWIQTSAELTTTNAAGSTVRSQTVTEAGPELPFSSNSTADTSQHTNTLLVPAQTHSAAADILSSTSTAQFTPPLKPPAAEGNATESLPTFSSPTVQDAGFKAPASSTQLQPDFLLTASTHQSSAPGRTPAGPPHQDLPSELNVGDEELKGSRRSSSPLDPLLAALLSVFIVTTAVVFIVLFFKFRQRTNHPEFHRLQDLPMDDLMEDTPLSMYAH